MRDAPMIRVVCIEDDPLDIELIQSALAADGVSCLIERVTQADALRATLKSSPPDLILSDWIVPGFGGQQALDVVRELSPDTPFILVSGLLGEERAIDLMRKGVTDFVVKSRLSRLGPTVRRVLADSMERAQRRRAELALEESQERLSLAVQSAELGLWDWHMGTNKVMWSPKYEELWGDMPGHSQRHYSDWKKRVHPDDLSASEACIQAAIDSGGAYSADFRVVWPDGSIHWIHGSGRCYLGADGRPIRMLGVVSDITARKEAEERIRHASQHDALTGLPNRSLLQEVGERLLAGAKRRGTLAALMFVDLDRFKLINDAFGHDIGDKVLQQVAQRLKACLRSEDIVGRLGGDEFVAVLANLNNESGVITAATHAMQSLGRPYEIGDTTLHITPSLGISLYPQDGTCVDELIRHADAAMYDAKETGRNKFRFFSPEIAVRASEALKIESHMRRALEQGEFYLYYQPVVDTGTLVPVGAEALVRWPLMGVPPDQFIPIAESSGLIQPLGDWILNEACRQQSEWRSQGLPSFPLSVNVSPLQFRQKNFAKKINDAISNAHLLPADLILEVTEGTLMKNVAEAAGILNALREIGVRVALDDFGTGYSSLSRLSRLPIDVLKVDQSFIRDFGGDPTNAMIADAIIALGRSLGLELTAEGIETEDALDFIRTRHCGHGQGFLFCKPLPPIEFQSWCANRLAA